jgi:hypothetical protein
MTQTIPLRVAENGGTVPMIVAENGGTLPLDAEQVRVIYVCPYPEYTGPTDVTPQVIAQSLATQDTLLKKDISISAIPYYETTNLSGGYTAISGG